MTENPPAISSTSPTALLSKLDDCPRLPLGPNFEATLSVLETVLATGLAGFGYIDPACRFVRVNDALAKLNGLRVCDVVGRTIEEVVGHQYWDIISPHMRRALSGQTVIDAPLTRESRTQPGVMRHVLVSYFPAEGPGHEHGVVVLVKDVSGQVMSQQALRNSEARHRTLADAAMHQAQFEEMQHFLADLRERMRTAPSSDELLWRVVNALGEEIDADRCTFGEVDSNAAEITVHRDYCRGVATMAGSYPRSSFGGDIRDDLSAGRTVVLNDTQADPRTADHYEAVYAPLRIRASINVPITTNGRQVATLAVQQAAPREWLSHEIALVEAVADRTWLAVENARLTKITEQVEARQRIFLRDILSSVTEGRLHLCHSTDELPQALPQVGKDTPLVKAEDIAKLRHVVRDVAAAVRFNDMRSMDLITATGEAAMNSVVHAEAGWGRVCTDGKEKIQIWIVDYGTGIAVEDLPQATLTVGYSTKATLGHGFKIMLHTADRVYLITGVHGTTVVLEQDRVEPGPRW